MSSGETESCENCSSNFGIFKRKKMCNQCNQAFCQFCVNRRNSLENRSESIATDNTNSSDRICVICRGICSPGTTTDDLMKLKLKHLKCFLNTANIPIGTCKEKRDLAELIMRNHEKFRLRVPPAQANPPNGSNNSGSGNQFNNTINSFMNNVQDFVNFNFNSVLNPNSSNSNNQQQQPQQSPPPSSQAQQPPPQPQPTPPPNGGPNYTLPSNLNSVFSFLGEQFPNVIHNTINSNLFNFNSNSGPNSSARSASHSSSTATSNTDRPAASGNRNQQTSREPENNEARREPAPAEQPHVSRPTTESTSASNRSSSEKKRRASLNDLKNENEIEDLSVKQLKEILASNFVEFKGCCERRELIDKAKRLYRSHEENKRRERELNEVEASKATASNNGAESDICKICMESLIDCVLLDCGHMVACIRCGKQLAECPICRQNVVRVVRVFKS